MISGIFYEYRNELAILYQFYESLRNRILSIFKNYYRYGVFALGNSSYPSFCGFGTWLDDALGDLSGTRLTKIAYGDELGDRDLEFRNWSQNAYKAALLESNLDVGFEAIRKTVKPEDIITKWVPVPSRLSSNKAEVICKGNFIAFHKSRGSAYNSI